MVYFLQELVTPDVQKEEIDITKLHEFCTSKIKVTEYNIQQKH